MPTSTAFSVHGFALLVLDAVILAVVFLRPFSRRYDDDSDKGSGNLVVMKPPLKPSYRRCGVFILTSLAVSVVIVGLKTPNLSDAYHNLVTELLLSVIPDPSVVDGYANSLLPVFQVSVLSFGCGVCRVLQSVSRASGDDPAERCVVPPRVRRG